MASARFRSALSKRNSTYLSSSHSVAHKAARETQLLDTNSQLLNHLCMVVNKNITIVAHFCFAKKGENSFITINEVIKL